MVSTNKRLQGQLIEQLAEQFLHSKGLVTLTRNYYSRYGEIDLVMAENSYIIFIEVRHRSRPHFGNGAESVTATKQKKLRMTAEHYLQQQHPDKSPDCRFDVISAAGRYPNVQLEWIQQAF